jgi:hypothetical protein
MSKEDAKRYIADMIKDLKEKMQEEMDDVGNALEFKTFDYERSSTLKGVEGQLEFERERAKKILAFEIKYQNAVRSRIGGAHVAEQEGDRDEKHLSEVWDRFAFAMTNEQAGEKSSSEFTIINWSLVTLIFHLLLCCFPS